MITPPDRRLSTGDRPDIDVDVEAQYLNVPDYLVRVFGHAVSNCILVI
jgi:hypothetical protein